MKRDRVVCDKAIYAMLEDEETRCRSELFLNFDGYFFSVDCEYYLTVAEYGEPFEFQFICSDSVFDVTSYPFGFVFFAV